MENFSRSLVSVLHPTAEKEILFSSAHGTLTKKTICWVIKQVSSNFVN